MEFLTPEFLVQNITGAGASGTTVFLIMRGKLDVLRVSVKNLSEQVARMNSDILKRIERLESKHFEGK